MPFGPAADLILKIALVVAALGLLGLIVLPVALPRSDYWTGRGMVVEQPVPFSHRHHVGDLGLDCRYCHDRVEAAASAGVPPTETCMTCHSRLFTAAPMLEPARRSWAEGDPLRWVRVNRLPDYVFFDHSVHVAKGVACDTCHGPVERMPLMAKAATLQMSWCLDCHREAAPGLTDCTVCHR